MHKIELRWEKDYFVASSLAEPFTAGGEERGGVFDAAVGGGDGNDGFRGSGEGEVW